MPRETGLELWNDLYSSWDPEYQAVLEFLCVAPDPDRLDDALRTAGRLLGDPVQTTESGPEHLDEPVDDLGESIARLTNGDSFFINVAGEIDGIAVTISFGADNIVLKFAGRDMFTEGQDAREPRAFRALTDAALGLAEVSGATEVRFGSEGVEVAPEEGIRIWERDEPTESNHSSSARMLFDEYVRTLDERFRRKKYEMSYDPADGFTRMYHRHARTPLRGHTLYFVGLVSDRRDLASIDRSIRRALAVAERAVTVAPTGARMWHKLFITFAMESPSSETIAGVRDDAFAAMFRESVVLVADLTERRLHDAGFWNWIGTFGVQQLARRRMLAFK